MFGLPANMGGLMVGAGGICMLSSITMSMTPDVRVGVSGWNIVGGGGGGGGPARWASSASIGGKSATVAEVSLSFITTMWPSPLGRSASKLVETSGMTPMSEPLRACALLTRDSRLCRSRSILVAGCCLMLPKFSGGADADRNNGGF